MTPCCLWQSRTSAGFGGISLCPHPPCGAESLSVPGRRCGQREYAAQRRALLMSNYSRGSEQLPDSLSPNYSTFTPCSGTCTLPRRISAVGDLSRSYSQHIPHFYGTLPSPDVAPATSRHRCWSNSASYTVQMKTLRSSVCSQALLLDSVASLSMACGSHGFPPCSKT